MITANPTTLKSYFSQLQQTIISELEPLENKSFFIDAWEKESDSPLQGHGVTALIEGGDVFERGGIAFSHVSGKSLPASATEHRPEVKGRSFEAIGVSLVLHPRNPMVPTVHMNVRGLVAKKNGEADITWFGGGMDLTPYYGYIEDCKHFHQTCANALEPFGADKYPAFKKWCDEYFFIKHRSEARGIGGIFFDDHNTPDINTAFKMTQAVGNAFLDAYLPIVQKHRNKPYTEQHKNWQNYRRGRYVEFNLVLDRGTLFGLQSGGRTESILMSMPPVANWIYQHTPEPCSEEMRLLTDFLPAQNWLDHE